MIQALYQKLVDEEDLTQAEAQEAVAEILAGQVSPSLIAAFLTALRMKGETPVEIAGAARAMRAAASKVETGIPVVLDTCGTGGDKQGSFNISTAAAFVAAGAGYTVAKHGNRSISSQCGSADVLEALGVKVDASQPLMTKALKEVGIAFFFAPLYHPAMKHAGPIRKELGIRTVFNVLGPLCNPAGANAQVIGVFSYRMLDTIARVLVQLGTQYAMVVHGSGHDEITLADTTNIAEIVNGRIRKKRVTARDFGLKRSPTSALAGGTKEENAAIIRRVLAGEKGPERDVVVVNAAAAILVAARAAGHTDVKDLKTAALAAAQSIDSGDARAKLEKLAAVSQSVPG
jgi:anthranilate phosphoribosyltransferase